MLRDATVILGDRPVLRGMDLELGPGITVLRGPNGSGKTTAIRALAGLVPLARCSRDVPTDLLYLGHRSHLLNGLTVAENLRFFAEMRGRDGHVMAAIERWGLGADADRPVERLSAGQRRRAALARVDTEPCALMLLDEPFAELDDAAVALLRTSIERCRSGGVAMLVASHGHAELDDLAAKVYRMSDGRAAPQ